MILTKGEILKEIKKKNIRITPFDKKSVGTASIDLALDKKIRVFKNSNAIEVKEGIDFKKITRIVDISKGYTLMPLELILGITKEKIELPEDICGWLQSRSRFARLGLMSHATAPFICPGVKNKQVLEIFNAGPHPLILKPGEKICQLIFERCEGKARYKGRFAKQNSI